MAKHPTQSEQAVSLQPTPEGYVPWLDELKARIHGAQQRAALAVNRELVQLYWQIGSGRLRRAGAARSSNDWRTICAWHSRA